MQNHHLKGAWYATLSNLMNPLFTDKQFNQYLKRHKEKINFYKKFIKGNRILDIGCGFGYSSIPLSRLGYKITALDNNKQVLKVIRKNAKKFGKDIRIVEGDVFNVDKIFKGEVFDCSISGGLLEHFTKKDIRKIIKKQLKLTPIVIADIPIHSNKLTLKKKYLNFRRRICTDGVYRNLWDKGFWIKNVLKGFNIIYNKSSKSSKHTGNFEKLTIVIKDH